MSKARVALDNRHLLVVRYKSDILGRVTLVDLIQQFSARVEIVDNNPSRSVLG